jgi:hypothetical protein
MEATTLPIIVEQPSLVVGVGGTGLKVVSAVRERIKTHPDPAVRTPRFQFLLIEADANDLHDRKRQQLFTAGEQIDLSGAVTRDMIRRLEHNAPDTHKWWPYPFDPQSVTNGCGAVRAAGRLALSRDARTVWDKISQALVTATNIAQARTGQDGVQIKVVLVGSMCGGTGSGILLDLAYMIREIAGGGIEGLSPDAPVAISAYLLTPEALLKEPNVRGLIRERVYSNGYAFLLELDNLNRRNGFSASYHGSVTVGPIYQVPFDYCYLMGAGNGVGTVPNLDVIENMVADAVFIELASTLAVNASSAMRNVEVLGTPINRADAQETYHTRMLRYSSACVASLRYPGAEVAALASAWAAQRLSDEHLLVNPRDLHTRADGLGTSALAAAGVVDLDAIRELLKKNADAEAPVLAMSRARSGGQKLQVQTVENQLQSARTRLTQTRQRLDDAKHPVYGAIWREVEGTFDEAIPREGLVTVRTGLRQLAMRLEGWKQHVDAQLDSLHDQLANAEDRHGWSAHSVGSTATGTNGSAPVASSGLRLRQALERQGGFKLFNRSGADVASALTAFEKDFDATMAIGLDVEVETVLSEVLGWLIYLLNEDSEDIERAIRVLGGGRSVDSIADGTAPSSADSRTTGRSSDWKAEVDAGLRRLAELAETDPFNLNVLSLPEGGSSEQLMNATRNAFVALCASQPLNGDGFWGQYCTPSEAEQRQGLAWVSPIQRVLPRKDAKNNSIEVEPDAPARRLATAIRAYASEWAKSLENLDLLEAIERSDQSLQRALRTLFAIARPLWTLNKGYEVANQAPTTPHLIVGVGRRRWEPHVTAAQGQAYGYVETGDAQRLLLFSTEHGATAMMLSAFRDESPAHTTYKRKVEQFERLAKQYRDDPSSTPLTSQAFPTHLLASWPFGERGRLEPLSPDPRAGGPDLEDESLAERVWIAGETLGHIVETAPQVWMYLARDRSGADSWESLRSGQGGGWQNALRAFKNSRQAQQDILSRVMIDLEDRRRDTILKFAQRLTEIDQEITQNQRANIRPGKRKLDERSYLRELQRLGLPSDPGPLW